MSKSKSYNQAKQEFLEYYCQILPQHNPDTLEKFLSIRNSPILLVSPHHDEEVQKLWSKNKLSYQPLNWFPHATTWPKNIQLGTSLPGFLEGWLYAMNPSSLFPVLALNLKASDAILDASAAPGGKSFAILNYLYPHKTDLLANDVSLPRYKRMRTVFKLAGYQLPTTNYPIQSLKYHLQPASFDKILLDAPCSSEKHVFNSKKHLKTWSPNRSLNLSHLQTLLLESLIPLLKPGGQLVYSTCSISPQENQQVIDEILNKHTEVSQTNFQKYAPGYDPAIWDPMFVSVLQKTTSLSPTPTP